MAPAAQRRARPMDLFSPGSATAPNLAQLEENIWVGPVPDDRVLAGDPAEVAVGRESIRLAFVAALQKLAPRQRAVLILRDVLGFAASEAARILGSTEESVSSALKRARATLRAQLPEPAVPPPAPESAREKQLVERLTHAYETGDVDGIIALFADDAWLTMPPAPLEYQGHGPIARFLTEIAFRDGRTYRLLPTRANGQLAVAAYLCEPAKPADAQANGLLVLALSGDRIQAMTRFTSGVLQRFGLPPG